jgi:hypothetical protein
MATWREMTRGDRDSSGKWHHTAGDGYKSERSLDKIGRTPITEEESGMKHGRPTDDEWTAERELQEKNDAGKRNPGKGVEPHSKGST